MPKQPDGPFVDMDRVNGGQVRPQDPLAFEELGRRAALDLHAFLDLRRLLGEMDVQRHLALPRVGGDDAHGLGIDGADAVDGRGDAHAIRIAQLVESARP